MCFELLEFLSSVTSAEHIRMELESDRFWKVVHHIAEHSLFSEVRNSAKRLMALVALKATPVDHAHYPWLKQGHPNVPLEFKYEGHRKFDNQDRAAD